MFPLLVLLVASMLLSLLRLLLAPMHLLVFLRLLAYLLLALLHYECCSMMSLLLLFSRPHAGKVFRTLRVPGRKPFAFPNAGKFWSLELGKVSLQRPDFYGMEECKMSHSRDRGRLFRHLGMQKVSFQGPEKFSAMGNVNKINGWREKFPGISSWIFNPWQWNFLVES